MLCCQSVLCNRQVILGLGEARIDLQRISLEHGLFREVAQRNSL